MRLLFALFIWMCGPVSAAAVGCSLQNPDADIRRFFPEMTDYSIHFLTFANQNPDGHRILNEALEGTLDPVYERPDTPYTLYIVNGGTDRLGYVFGANQRGRYSNIQVIAIVNADIELQHVYIQRIRSPAYRAFQSESFGEALTRLPLSQYPQQRECYQVGDCANLPFSDPSEGSQVEDYRAIVRALAKLHLLSELLLHPGESPIPSSDRATAEWIGNIGGSVLSRRIGYTPYFATSESLRLRPDEPVVYWNHPSGALIVPVQLLRSTPIIAFERGGSAYRLIWSQTSGSAVVFQTNRNLEMTDDILFGVRLLRDSESTARFHPLLGTTVYGEPSFSLDLLPGILTISYEQAQLLSPEADTFRLQTPPIPTASAVRASGPMVMVIREDLWTRAWRADSWNQNEIQSEDPVVQFWMTEEGYRSTFPNGELR